MHLRSLSRHGASTTRARKFGMMPILEAVHGFMPWGLSIVTTTVLLRTFCTFPLAYLQFQRQARLKNITPLIDAWKNTIQRMNKMDKTISKRELNGLVMYSNKLKRRINFLYHKFKCQPIHSLILPVVQIPLFLSITMAIRDLSGAPFLWFDAPEIVAQGIHSGGFLFVTDLTVADPTLILPILVGALHYFNMQLNKYLRGQASRSMLGEIFNSSTFIGTLMCIATHYAPAVFRH